MSRSNGSNSACPNDNRSYFEVRQVVTQITDHLRARSDIEPAQIDAFAANMSRKLNALVRSPFFVDQDRPVPNIEKALPDSLLTLFEIDLRSSVQALVGDRCHITLRCQKQ